MSAHVTVGFGEGARTRPVKAGRATLDVNSPDLNGFPMGMATVTLGEDEDGPLAVILTLAPNLEFAPHYHDTDQCFVVLEGALRVGRTWFGPGSVRVQEAGAVYGPLLTGPEGCKTIAFYRDRSRTFPDQFAGERDRQRAEQLDAKFRALFPPGAFSSVGP
jgi:hypothetical protein